MLRYVRTIQGDSINSVRDYPLHSSYTAPKSGDLVKLQSGQLVKASAGDTSATGVLEGVNFEGLGVPPKVGKVRVSPYALYEVSTVGAGALVVGNKYGVDANGNLDTANTTNTVFTVDRIANGKPQVTVNTFYTPAGLQFVIPDVGYNMLAYQSFVTERNSLSQWIFTVVGDSITRAEYTSNEPEKAYSVRLKAAMAGVKASGGDGFISAREGWWGGSSIGSYQTLAGANGGPKRTSYNNNADAAGVYSDTSGVTGMLGTGGFGGEYVRIGNAKEIRFRTDCSRFYVLYMDANAGNGGKASFMVDGVAVATNIGDNTVASDTPRIAGPYDVTPGQHTISVRTTSGNFNTVGIISEKGSSGLIVNRVGREAWKSADWANRAHTITQFGMYPPHVALIALGTNDVKDQTTTQFKVNMTTIISGFKAMPTVKAVGIITMPQMHSSWAGAVNWPNYVQAMKELCNSEGCFGINLYDAFEQSYALAQAKGLFARNPNDFTGLSGSDIAHWSDLGHEFVAQCIAQKLL